MSVPVLIVVGSVNRDSTSFVPRLPQPGETVLAGRGWSGLGGKGANQAVAAAAHGARTWFVGAVGADPYGSALIAELEAAGVRAREVAVDAAAPSGHAVVIVEESGENLIVVEPGANAAVSAQAVRRSCERIAAESDGADIIVLCQGEISPAAVSAAAAFCEEFDHRFVLNLAPVIELADEVLQAADPLIVNRTELTTLLGSPSGDAEQDAVLVAGSLRTRVIVTLGAEGAVSVDGRSSERLRVTAESPDEVVNTTGAGDAFVGALTAALLAGHDPADSLSIAARAGSRAVTHAASSSH